MATLSDPRREPGVVFINEANDEVLWRSRGALAVPAQDESVGLVVSGSVPTWYKVEAVKREYLYDGIEILGQPQASDDAYVGVAVIVSVIA